MSNLEQLKTKLVSGLVCGVFPAWSTVSYRPIGYDSFIIAFDSHVKSLDQVKVGSSYKLCPEKPVQQYRMIVKTNSVAGYGLSCEWKNGLKPVNWMVIERELLS